MVTISLLGNLYESLITVAEADVILASHPSLFQVWDNLFPDQKARYLIEASRQMVTYNWKGELLSPGQVLPFPRDSYPTTPDPVKAYCAYFAAGSAIPATDGNIKRLKAGSAEIEYHGRNRKSSASVQTANANFYLIKPYLREVEGSGSDFSTGIGYLSTPNCPKPTYNEWDLLV